MLKTDVQLKVCARFRQGNHEKYQGNSTWPRALEKFTNEKAYMTLSLAETSISPQLNHTALENLAVTSLRTNGLLGLRDLSRFELDYILDMADTFADSPSDVSRASSLTGKVLLYAFYEPSTRTRLSFETAMLRLGGKTMGFADAQLIRAGGFLRESLKDTFHMLQNYADVIVLRHTQTYAAHDAAQWSQTPIINAGDGFGEHPTQVLTDLLTVRRKFGTVDGLKFLLIGDGRMRAMHSLGYALSNYDVEVTMACLDELMIPESFIHDYRKRGLSIKQVSSIEEAIPVADVICMNTVDTKHLTPSLNERHTVRNADGDLVFLLPEALKLNAKMLASLAKDSAMVLHTLPRREELSCDVDETQHAGYWEEGKLGVPLKMALLSIMLGERQNL